MLVVRRVIFSKMAGWNLQTTEAARAARRNRNKPKMCRRYRDMLRRLCSVYPHTHTHTQAHTLHSHTHIAPRPKEQQCARTPALPLCAPEEEGAAVAHRQVGRRSQCKTVGVFREPRKRKKALVRRPPVQETETGSSKPCVVVVVSEAAWRGLLDKTEIVLVVQTRPRIRPRTDLRKESEKHVSGGVSPSVVSRCELSATEKRTAVPARRGSKRSSIDRSSTWAVIFNRRRRRYGVSGFPCIVPLPSQPRSPLSLLTIRRERERERCVKESPAAISRRRAESVAVLSVRAGMRRRSSRRARTPAPRRGRPGSRRVGADASGRWLLRHHGEIAPTDSDAAAAAAALRRSSPPPLRRWWWLPPLMTPSSSSCAGAAARLVSLRRTSRRSTRPAWAPCCVASSCFS